MSSAVPPANMASPAIPPAQTRQAQSPAEAAKIDSNDPYSFIYDNNATVMTDTELNALREMYPTLTDDELRSMKNPDAAYQFALLQWNIEQQSIENRIRANETGLKTVESSVFNSVSEIFQRAMSLARQNRQSEALQVLQSANPYITNGMSSLSGSGTEGVDETFIRSLQSQYGGLTKSIGEIKNKIMGVNLTDEELLRTTGLDLEGRTEVEHNQEMLKWRPLATMSQRELDRKSPFLELQNNSPTGFEDFRRKVELNKTQAEQP